MYQLKNLTGETLTLRLSDERLLVVPSEPAPVPYVTMFESKFRIPAADAFLRVRQQKPILVDLPEPQDNVVWLVPDEVRLACPGRLDLFSVGAPHYGMNATVRWYEVLR